MTEGWDTHGPCANQEQGIQVKLPTRLAALARAGRRRTPVMSRIRLGPGFGRARPGSATACKKRVPRPASRAGLDEIMNEWKRGRPRRHARIRLGPRTTRNEGREISRVQCTASTYGGKSPERRGPPDRVQICVGPARARRDGHMVGLGSRRERTV